MPFDRNAPLPSGVEVGAAWGPGPTERYAALAARFRPVFARIRAQSVARELERRLPTDEIAWLRDAGFRPCACRPTMAARASASSNCSNC